MSESSWEKELELEDLRQEIWDEDDPKKVRKLQKRFRKLERVVYPEKFRIGDVDEKGEEN